jgi:hypothetical protein
VVAQRTYQLTHECARGEVSLQEADEISAGKQQRACKDGSCRLGPHRLPKCVEAGSRQNEASYVGDIGQCQHGQRDGCLPALLRPVYDHSLLDWLLLFLRPRCVVGVLFEVRVVHGAEVVRVFALVLLHVGLVDPAQGVHEPACAIS